DLQQRYERDARRRLRSQFRGTVDATLADELGGEGWYREEPQRRGYPDRHWAEVARDVIEIQESTRNAKVLEDLARARKIPYATAKEWVTKATTRGFLTKPGRGRRNERQLTLKAK